MSAAIGVGVPMANLLAVGVLSHGTGKGHLGTLKLVAMNPFLLASMAGLIVSMSGITLPTVPMQTIGKLAGIAVPLALLSLGANMDWRALHRLGGGALAGLGLAEWCTAAGATAAAAAAAMVRLR